MGSYNVQEDEKYEPRSHQIDCLSMFLSHLLLFKPVLWSLFFSSPQCQRICCVQSMLYLYSVKFAFVCLLIFTVYTVGNVRSSILNDCFLRFKDHALVKR